MFSLLNYLFAGRGLWSRRLRARAERAFAQRCGNPTEDVATGHLFAIGFDAKGIPISLFAVHSWVTGDLMLSADATLDLLDRFALDTGYSDIEKVITAVMQLYQFELRALMLARDAALHAHPAPDKLADTALELLSEIRIELDAKLAGKVQD